MIALDTVVTEAAVISELTWCAAAATSTRQSATTRNAVKLRAQVLSRSDPELASSINGLAILRRKMGHYEKAETLYRCARELLREVRFGSLRLESWTAALLFIVIPLPGARQQCLGSWLAACRVLSCNGTDVRDEAS